MIQPEALSSPGRGEATISAFLDPALSKLLMGPVPSLLLEGPPGAARPARAPLAAAVNPTPRSPERGAEGRDHQTRGSHRDVNLHFLF